MLFAKTVRERHWHGCENHPHPGGLFSRYENLRPAAAGIEEVGQEMQMSIGKKLLIHFGAIFSVVLAMGYGWLSTTAGDHWLVFVLFGLALAVSASGVYTVRNVSATLDGVAGEISGNAIKVEGAAGQVSSVSQQLAQGASEQAASLEETSASTEEISSMTRRNADHSQSAATLMQETARHVGEANQKLEQMLASMRDINASSEKISKIIKVIDEIAFQTNILALNAAVEAARAGEAGMGFAVVADEVRNLAQRCAQAARDTTGLIEESIGMASEGSRRVDQVVEAIRFVTENANKVKSLIEEVSSGSREQANGIEQVAKTLTEMGQVTQRTAASAEEGAAASEELTGLSAGMKRSVTRLHALVGGGGVVAGTLRYTSERVPGRPAAADSVAAVKDPGPKVAYNRAKPAHVAAEVAKARADFPLDDDFKEF
jgi:methyl-accepting chemotaxis protein/methyl-accepting chemotaxis protein-1 (serine sensor receptor)